MKKFLALAMAGSMAFSLAVYFRVCFRFGFHCDVQRHFGRGCCF